MMQCKSIIFCIFIFVICAILIVSLCETSGVCELHIIHMWRPEIVEDPVVYDYFLINSCEV